MTYYSSFRGLWSKNLSEMFDSYLLPCYHIKKGFSLCERGFMKKVINLTNSPNIACYSQAVEDGGFIFTTGIVPIDPVTGEIFNGDVRVQTELILTNLDNLLKQAGCSLKNVVKTTVFMTDLTQFAEMNAVYSTFFKTNPPARTTVQVAALAKGSSVEIEAIAKK